MTFVNPSLGSRISRWYSKNLAFIFADLIVLPILDIYRKYHGWRMMWFLLVTFYVSMAAAALVVELVFQAVGLVPSRRRKLSKRRFH